MGKWRKEFKMGVFVGKGEVGVVGVKKSLSAPGAKEKSRGKRVTQASEGQPEGGQGPALQPRLILA